MNKRSLFVMMMILTAFTAVCLQMSSNDIAKTLVSCAQIIPTSQLSNQQATSMAHVFAQ